MENTVTSRASQELDAPLLFFRGESTDYGDCSTYTHVQCNMDLHAEYTRVKSGVFLGVAETIVASKLFCTLSLGVVCTKA